MLAVYEIMLLMVLFRVRFTRRALKIVSIGLKIFSGPRTISLRCRATARALLSDISSGGRSTALAQDQKIVIQPREADFMIMRSFHYIEVALVIGSSFHQPTDFRNI
jgi:hypothetical protein